MKPAFNCSLVVILSCFTLALLHSGDASAVDLVKLKDYKGKNELKDPQAVRHDIKKHQDLANRLAEGKNQEAGGSAATSKVTSDEQVKQGSAVKVLEGANSKNQGALRLLE
jgi:hypothetical protein